MTPEPQNGISLFMAGMGLGWITFYYYQRWTALDELEKEPTSVTVEIPDRPFCKFNYHCSFKDYGDDEEAVDIGLDAAFFIGGIEWKKKSFGAG